MPLAPLVAGVELGGTKCVCTLATGPGDIRDELRIETRSPAETVPEIQRVLRNWHRGNAYRALGIASFGPLELDPASPSFGAIVGTPKPGWSDAVIAQPGLYPTVPIGFDTDVTAAALAEGRWGNARGLSSFAYVTVGTGIGVGTIVNGHPVRGLGHSEAGHLRVPRLPGDDWPGACPYHGDCVEGLASGTAIRAFSGSASEQLAASAPAWDRVAAALAGLAHNLIYTAAPQRILFGGGVMTGQPHLLPRVRAALVRSLAGYAVARVVAPTVDEYLAAPGLGSRAGPLGAIALALRTIEPQPGH